jgi:hypothetical protein
MFGIFSVLMCTSAANRVNPTPVGVLSRMTEAWYFCDRNCSITHWSFYRREKQEKLSETGPVPILRLGAFQAGSVKDPVLNIHIPGIVKEQWAGISAVYLKVWAFALCVSNDPLPPLKDESNKVVGGLLCNDIACGVSRRVYRKVHLLTSRRRWTVKKATRLTLITISKWKQQHNWLLTIGNKQHEILSRQL